MLKASLFVVLMLIFSGCSNKGLLVVDDNVAKYIKNSKKVVIYTPDVHIINVGVGSNEEDMDNTVKALEEIESLSANKLSVQYIVNKINTKQTCESLVLGKACNKEFIVESRKIIESIRESRDAFGSVAKEEFEYFVDQKNMDEFKEADLVVYINATEYTKTAGRITTDFLFSFTVGLLTGYIPIVNTPFDYANILVFDRSSGKAILYDQMLGNYDFDDQEELEEIVDRLLVNLNEKELLAIN